jgi:hypothetical protein
MPQIGTDAGGANAHQHLVVPATGMVMSLSARTSAEPYLSRVIALIWVS